MVFTKHRGSDIENLWFEFFSWGEKLRMIPQHFIFPHTNVKTMWNLWFHGNESEKIQPYKYLIKNIKDIDVKTVRNKVHRTSKVMTALVDIAIKKRFIKQEDEISSFSQSESDNIFDECYPDLVCQCYGQKGHTRPYDIHCDTMAYWIYKGSRNKRQKVEFDVEDEEIE